MTYESIGSDDKKSVKFVHLQTYINLPRLLMAVVTNGNRLTKSVYAVHKTREKGCCYKINYIN
jgi:hypothetical protein